MWGLVVGVWVVVFGCVGGLVHRIVSLPAKLLRNTTRGGDRMRVLLVLPALGMMLAALGCSQVSVLSDYDPAANFSGLQTYAWYAAEQPKTGDVRLDNPLLDTHIRNAVEKALNAKGFIKADANPDFQLIYHAAVTKEIAAMRTASAVYPPPGYGWGYVATPVWVERSVPYTYQKGSLIVDIIDAKNEKLMWRGSIQAELDKTATPQMRAARIETAVKDMLAQFPPDRAK